MVGLPGENWLGVPLRAEGRVIGIVVVQTYAADEHYSDDDVALLTFVGQHIGSALARARAIEETRERNAELAVINEIGSALAQQLDFGAIIDLVGERVRSIFGSPSMFVALYDQATGRIAFPYSVDDGERFERTDVELGPGLTSTIISTRRPVRVGSDDEAGALGAIRVGGSAIESFLSATSRRSPSPPNPRR